MRPPATSWRLVSLMVALSAMSYFDRTIMSIAGPAIMKEFGISETQMGTVYSAFLLSYAILMSPGGALADRFGARLILAIAGLGNALLTGVTALCSRLPEFLLVRLAFGVTSAPLYPACGRMTADWFASTAAGRVQGLIMAGAALGSAISPVVFSAMMLRFGWRLSFWLAAAATAALYAVWHWQVRDRPGAAVPATRGARNWGRLLRDRNIILLCASYFCLNYFEYIFFYWIYYYFGEIRHMGKSESAAYVTVLMLTMVVMTPLGGWVSDRLVARYGQRIGRRAVPLAGMTLSALLLYTGAGGLGTVATVTLLSLSFGFSASAEGPFWASTIDIGGEQVGAACGLLNSVGNLGGIVAPTLTPILAGRFGWTAGLYFGSLMVALGVVAWFFIDPAPQLKAAVATPWYSDG